MSDIPDVIDEVESAVGVIRPQQTADSINVDNYDMEKSAQRKYKASTKFKLTKRDIPRRGKTPRDLKSHPLRAGDLMLQSYLASRGKNKSQMDRGLFGDRRGEHTHIIPYAKSIEKQGLIILDLNGTIIRRKPHGIRKRGEFESRPYLMEFLTHAFDCYHVGVWTSAKRINMEPIVREAFGKFYPLLAFCWYRGKCDDAPTQSKPWATIKDVSKIPRHYGKIIIIDDSDEKIKNMKPSDQFWKIATWYGNRKHDNQLVTMIVRVLNAKKEDIERRIADVVDNLVGTADDTVNDTADDTADDTVDKITANNKSDEDVNNDF